LMKPENTILIVDDDLAHRTMLRTLLAGWGYAVVEADDGSAAIAQVRKRPFDLILMDVRMVKVSGLEALAEIKAFNPAIPVIIMTAYASVETAVEALKKGAYDYLTKPLDFDELRKAMNTKWNVDIPEAKTGIGGHCLPKDIRYVTSLAPSAILESAIEVDKKYREWLSKSNE